MADRELRAVRSESELGTWELVVARPPHRLRGVFDRYSGYTEKGAVSGVPVDAHFDRAVSAGAEVVRPLGDTDYGARDYVVRNPEGNLWSFGTSRPSLRSISARRSVSRPIAV